MNAHSANAPEPVLLLIADISGYTRYMTANAKTLAHSQTIITELVKAIVKQIKLPLEVAKLEGDAVFFFCRKQNTSQPWPETRRLVGGQLLAFFRMFSEKLAELGQSNTCTCHACTHLEKLRLKVVVHSGVVLFHRFLNFVELAGVDVIVVHRLLKNSVAADQYLLLTEAARQDVEFSGPIQLNPGSETYDDLGCINTLVYLPGGQPEPQVPDPLPPGSIGTQFGRSWKLLSKLWFAPFVAQPQLAHLPVAVSGVKRFGFALLTLVLTPLYLPVGTLFVWLSVLRRSTTGHHPEAGHAHKPDGSCCGGN